MNDITIVTAFFDIGRGIWPAIAEFMSTHPEWQLVERRTNNNGLTILKRIN